jgi:pimeloyl-ACP methyl ester carboxylesterase
VAKVFEVLPVLVKRCIRQIVSLIIFATSVLAENFQGIEVTVLGNTAVDAPAIVFIPGLNSNKETFVGTCKALKSSYRCYLLSLPGFAGVAPLKNLDAGFVEPMRDRILAYVKAKNISRPIIMGHSLGGLIALMMAEESPEVARALVLVDAFPYFPAILNPTADAKAMLVMAQNTKQQTLLQPLAHYQSARMQTVTRGMSNQSARVKLLQMWTKSSDRNTSAQAMFDMMTIDMRKRAGQIKTPTLVFGAWAAYKEFGWTKASTEAIFKTQFQKLVGVQIKMSDTAYHYIAWDDPVWMRQETVKFLMALPKP